MDNFVCEAKILMQLHHPNIITMYEVSMDGDPYYFVFEYMDHGNLEIYLKIMPEVGERGLWIR